MTRPLDQPTAAPSSRAGTWSHPGFKPEDRYITPPPWDIGRPQPALLALARSGAVRGRVLDAGCGTGEHALMAAGLGLDATGIDLASNALEQAREKARARGLTARFLQHDVRRLAEVGKAFDTVLDCGLFHLFEGQDRAAYVGSLRSVVPPGGRYFMLGFSDRDPSARGHKLTRDEIAAAFAEGWRVDSIEPATIDATFGPAAVQAWLLAVTRVRDTDQEGESC
jgi:ubiquinone/menaquinone biosynthesis C-methylase UbiE